MLSKERVKLRDVDAYTILDYIKTSIEILMNMKMEEQQDDNATGANKNKKAINKSQNPNASYSQTNNRDSNATNN